jgi:hypothetical protein
MDFPFLSGEWSRLVEHVLRDRELADVVQQEPDAKQGEAVVDVVEAPLALEVDPAVAAHVAQADGQAERRDGERVLHRVAVGIGEVVQGQSRVDVVGDVARDQHRDLGHVLKRRA